MAETGQPYAFSGDDPLNVTDPLGLKFNPSSCGSPNSATIGCISSRRKQGREVLFQVESGRLDQATRAMAELASRWDRRLDSIKRLAESAHAEATERSRQ